METVGNITGNTGTIDNTVSDVADSANIVTFTTEAIWLTAKHTGVSVGRSGIVASTDRAETAEGAGLAIRNQTESIARISRKLVSSQASLTFI